MRRLATRGRDSTRVPSPASRPTTVQDLAQELQGFAQLADLVSRRAQGLTPVLQAFD